MIRILQLLLRGLAVIHKALWIFPAEKIMVGRMEEESEPTQLHFLVFEEK